MKFSSLDPVYVYKIISSRNSIKLEFVRFINITPTPTSLPFNKKQDTPNSTYAKKSIGASSTRDQAFLLISRAKESSRRSRARNAKKKAASKHTCHDFLGGAMRASSARARSNRDASICRATDKSSAEPCLIVRFLAFFSGTRARTRPWRMECGRGESRRAWRCAMYGMDIRAYSREYTLRELKRRSHGASTRATIDSSQICAPCCASEEDERGKALLLANIISSLN